MDGVIKMKFETSADLIILAIDQRNAQIIVL